MLRVETSGASEERGKVKGVGGWVRRGGQEERDRRRNRGRKETRDPLVVIIVVRDLLLVEPFQLGRSRGRVLLQSLCPRSEPKARSRQRFSPVINDAS